MATGDVNQADYKTVRSVGEFDEGFIDGYWGRVTETLERVFGISASEAENKVGDLRRRLSEQRANHPDTELHFYHLDPFQVAADLIGLTAPRTTAEQKQRYVAMNLPENDRPADDQLGRVLPEDLYPRRLPGV
jgi:hypothetical protein